MAASSPPPPEPEAPRGLAALFGQRADAASVSSAPVGTPGDDASVFAESVEIEGSLEGEGDVHLRGHVRGSISITGTLVVAETGRVHADVAAREVICGGTVEGNILATEKVRVQGTGLVQGDIDSPSIVIEDGGGVEGFVQMAPPGGEQDEPEEPAAMLAPPPASGRLGRAPRPAEAAAPPSYAPPSLHAAAAGGASGAPPKLTREMLMGPSPVAPAPATPPNTSPSHVFDDAEAPLVSGSLDAGPLGGDAADVLDSGNGSDGPLMSGPDHGADSDKRPVPDF